ncbi:glycosyltransferase family 9 protein [Aquifex aeolicus]|uniref:glycosyltransferase family 9 protein n=1 Tax=Aquifex aeolicus TaxID=63363 RepID=UPI001FB5A791|nr:glycosyltransferase family 9 protein [Aquifex aeolicus]
MEILKRRGYETIAVGNTDYFSIAKEVGYADGVYSFIPEEEFDLKVIISFEGNVKPFPEKREWIVKHYLNSLGLGEEFSTKLPIKPVQDSPLKGKVVIHPSSGSKKKNPPLEVFLKLKDFLEERGKEVVFLLGEAEEHLREVLSPHFLSLSPLEIAKHLKTAGFYVGLDSGISHLASYLGVPSFIVYGPTDPLVWRPIGDKVFQISLNLDCSPCFPNVCEERMCLDTEEVLRKTKETLLRYWNSL